MAVCIVRRIDEVYREDRRAGVPVHELMRGPEGIPDPVLWIHPEKRFRQLAGRWRAETGHHSSLDKIVGNSAYKEIVRMGWAAVPLLLDELAGPEPDLWGPALSAITGAQPVPQEAAGRLDEIAGAWIRWARDRGIRA